MGTFMLPEGVGDPSQRDFAPKARFQKFVCSSMGRLDGETPALAIPSSTQQREATTERRVAPHMRVLGSCHASSSSGRS
jgi:hypothetical protein